MGLFGSLKKAFKGSKTVTKTKRKKRKKLKRSVGTVGTVVNPVKMKHSAGNLLKEWSSKLEKVQDHPLSQVKIINTDILTMLTEILSSMDSKLDKLAKLDEIVSLLNESKQQMEMAGLPVDSIDQAISKVRGLTIKDKQAMGILKKDELTTEAFASKAGLSRSTASTRLNRLYSFGLVDKTAKGKRIAYKLRQKLLSKDKKKNKTV